MKRRLVLRETPIKTKKKGKVVTVQNVENILILNMYRDKDLTCRYCMNTDTGEYETWDAKTGEWSVMKAHRAAGGVSTQAITRVFDGNRRAIREAAVQFALTTALQLILPR